MTRDEQAQLKKDTLWDIHLADKEIACLERKVGRAMEAMQEACAAHEDGSLGAAGERLVRRRTDESTPETLPRLPAPSDVVSTVSDLQRARQRRDKLQAAFDRM